jgi:predicted nuclease of restriction endonuclease-like (RecB) superfamily
MRITNEQARYWYMQEAASQGWSVRVLLRQITSFAHQRTLRNDKRKGSRKRVDRRSIEPREFIKDPYVLEFLEAKELPILRENRFIKAAKQARP